MLSIFIRNIILFSIICWGFSCSFLKKNKCERKLNYVVKHCPDLIDTAKTIVVFDTIIKSEMIAGEVVQKLDSLYLDSLINIYISKIDTFKTPFTKKEAEIIKQLPRRIYENLKFSKDTLGVIFTISASKGVIHYTIFKKEVEINKQLPFNKYQLNNVTRVEETPWWRNIWFWISMFLLVLLGVIVVRKVLRLLVEIG